MSEICILDTASGDILPVLAHEGHVEAPNWHPDGFLLVNGGGRLFRVPLDAPRLEPVETGRLRALNNDHGISPDGRMLALSDKGDGGLSAIHLMPVAGGPAVRVSPPGVPSWWHSWSPDGARLAFAGVRGGPGGPVAILTCALDGTDEVCVTADFDHADGPDYSPDGEWIWFNGERGGAVDLWRIRPDGTGLSRMTGDDAVNWFPHPSPDGAQVVYLAYPPGTRGHPADMEVTLRIMPAGGGEARILTALHGGQGTINVPSWAPDSRRLAFVRYRP
ncbi:MAG: PD40 domain-containing protein [Rubellimicrobium sp.]|nr:PD40 domain-containing protein [Rubellimicrobium sp.]